MVRKATATQDHAVGPDKAVFSYLDRLGRLAGRFQIDAMRKQLGAETGNGSKRADAHPGGAINQVTAANSRMRLKNQFRMAVRLMREVSAFSGGKAGDPVQLSDNRVSAEL